uniref:Solute carrier family 25 member 36 n=1 Tax=Monodon monoceros TaxID=40151 RepID=A0A8C6BX19_MONMO
MKTEPEWEAAWLQRRGEGGSGRLLQPRLRQFPSPSRGRRAAPVLGRGGSCGPASAPGGHAGGRMSQRATRVRLFAAGGCGGPVGAIPTCPLEVVKTRLQSSSVTLYISEVQLNTMAGASVNRVVSPGPLHCLKVILEKEGPRSPFTGFGRNLLGVAPSRAIYFAAYSNCTEKSLPVEIWTNLNLVLPQSQRPTPFGCPGEKRMGAFECVRKVYQTDGLRGFYRGMSASYAGISETVIHFVIYESIK